MNKEWSLFNKTMQIQLKKEETYKEGIQTLLKLRQELFDEIYCFKRELKRKDFDAMPFMKAKGYHNKTIAYSLWHIFRIEDIVVHSLIQNDEQIFFLNRYQKRIGSPIQTTGNELAGYQIANFSKLLDLEELYQYMLDVKKSTDQILLNISYNSLKRKITREQKEILKSLNVVSDDENACWLIDYWCKKDIRGLLQMPLSRHWIMHIEASLRIKNKILEK